MSVSASANRESSDEEIDFGGNPDYFTKIFDYCGSEAVLNSGEEPIKIEEKSKKTKKPKSGVKKRKGKTITSSSELNSSQGDGESSATKQICDEFAEFIRSTKVPVPVQSTLKPRGIMALAPDSPIYLDSDNSNSTDTEVCEILDDAIVLSPVVERDYLNVRVRWKGAILKFAMSASDKVSKLRALVSAEVKVLSHHILLFLHEDDSTAMEDSKSLKESGVEIAMVLEGMQIVSNCSTNGSRDGPPAKRMVVVVDPTMVRVKLQQETNTASNKDLIKMDIKKTMTFKELQKLYAEKFNLQPDNVMFRFDGDLVDLEETPESLDFEDDECLDVVLIGLPKQSPVQKSPPKKSPVKKSPKKSGRGKGRGRRGGKRW